MADEFKGEMNKTCGIGGLHCHCCNDYFGKDKKVLRRLVRHRLKQKVKKDIDTEMEE